MSKLVKQTLLSKGRPKLSSVSRVYTEYAGGKGSRAAVCFLKC